MGFCCSLLVVSLTIRSYGRALRAPCHGPVVSVWIFMRRLQEKAVKDKQLAHFKLIISLQEKLKANLHRVS